MIRIRASASRKPLFAVERNGEWRQFAGWFPAIECLFEGRIDRLVVDAWRCLAVKNSSG